MSQASISSNFERHAIPSVCEPRQCESSGSCCVISARHSYYVRTAVAPGMFDPPENGAIELVDEAAARPEIADAKIQEHTYRGK